MHIIVKHTTTICEYKQKRAEMQKQAELLIDKEKETSMEDWSHGDILKVWEDVNGNICVECEDGKIFANKRGQRSRL